MPERALCARQGQWNPNKLPTSEHWVLSSMHSPCYMPLFSMNVTEFLNLTTVPTRSCQNHTVTTVPMVLHFSILICHFCWPSGHLSLPAHSPCHDDGRRTQPASRHSSPWPQSWGSTGGFDVLTRSSGRRGGLWDGVCKVCSDVQQRARPSHALTTPSLTHPEQLPVPQFHSCKCPTQVCHFYLFHWLLLHFFSV